MRLRIVKFVLSTAIPTMSALTLALACRTSPSTTTSEPSPAPPPSTEDPAVVRGRMLARLDAAADDAATRAHLEARLIVDDLLPVPYLGIDATPVPDGMKIDRVYPDSPAEASGLRVGDVLMQIDQDVTRSKAAMSRSIRRHRIGDVAELKVSRNGSPIVLRAPIGHRPEEDEDEAEQFPDLPPVPETTETLAFDFHDESWSDRMQSLVGGHGRLGNWIVLHAASDSFLRQSDPDSTGIRFPMVVAKSFDAADVAARARFRFSGGKVDRAAGVILRFRDPGNYLVARANAAEADLRIFRVVNGLRQTLPGGVVPCPTDDDRWHTLEFRCEGARLVASVDGKAVASSYDTFFRRGSVGLWTKSDSQTDFADVRFEPLLAGRTTSSE